MATNLARKSFNVTDECLHVLCDPCRFTGNTTVAIKYCTDCNGHLCPNCVNTHMKGKNTKKHTLSFIKTKRTSSNTRASEGTAQSGKSFDTKCLEHTKPVVSYCLTHDALCCRVCIASTHVECKLQVLSEAASRSRDSRELRTIESGIRRLQTKFEETQRKKQGILQHLGLQNDTFSKAVKTYRKTLDNILDKLESNLQKGKDRHYDGKVEELRGCLKICQDAVSVLTGSLNEIDIASRQGDDQSLFLTLKKVQAVSSRYETVLTDVEKQLPRNYTFHFQPDIAIERFLKGVNELGTIRDESNVMNGPYIS
ncbi:E3 ubiquitin-protein ligase TRIM71-like [Mercenaria mercenaria]|uniref:E3 ubiquitin-protein ligase TRIM71-like n=1 Tax=Mercenaria mercenaria TaxID=6596 RepID=UPI00234EE2D2|nr:E3 ubiquitin-protein ligase TRIM71-like [Mercenaria mercenaria]